MTGDCIPKPHLGLFWPFTEKVAEVGVLKPGDCGRYGYWLFGLSGRYISCEYLDRGSPAMTNGGGLLLMSSLWLYTEPTEPMLDADKEFR